LHALLSALGGCWLKASKLLCLREMKKTGKAMAAGGKNN